MPLAATGLSISVRVLNMRHRHKRFEDRSGARRSSIFPYPLTLCRGFIGWRAFRRQIHRLSKGMVRRQNGASVSNRMPSSELAQSTAVTVRLSPLFAAQAKGKRKPVLRPLLEDQRWMGASKCPGQGVSTETRAGCSVGWRTGEGTHGEPAGPELASERITHPHVCVAVPVGQRGFA
jgi:hypothetical protein